MIATHRALDHAFRIDGDDWGIGFLEAIFAGFEVTEPVEAREVYRLEVVSSGARATVGTGKPLDQSPGDAASHLVTSINREAMLSMRTSSVVHAGVVALGDVCVVIPAVSGSGKSTLTAALVAEGFSYLSDELAPISDAGQVVAYPKPIVVRNDSKSVLDDLAHADVGGDRFEPWFLDAGRLAGGRSSIGESRQVTHVVVPSFEERAEIDVAPLTPGQVAVALMVNCFNVARRGRPSLESLARIAEQCSGVAVVHGDARAAAREIRRIVES